MKLRQKLEKVQQHLDTIEEGQFDSLHFNWEGIRFFASSTTELTGDHIIELNATLGRLYYTVEDAGKRAAGLERFFVSNRTIDGTYRIDQRGTIYYRNLTKTAEHHKGSQLIDSLVIILLEAESHLRAIRSHLRTLH